MMAPKEPAWAKKIRTGKFVLRAAMMVDDYLDELSSLRCYILTGHDDDGFPIDYRYVGVAADGRFEFAPNKDIPAAQLPFVMLGFGEPPRVELSVVAPSANSNKTSTVCSGGGSAYLPKPREVKTTKHFTLTAIDEDEDEEKPADKWAIEATVLGHRDYDEELVVAHGDEEVDLPTGSLVRFRLHKLLVRRSWFEGHSWAFEKSASEADDDDEDEVEEAPPKKAAKPKAAAQPKAAPAKPKAAVKRKAAGADGEPTAKKARGSAASKASSRASSASGKGKVAAKPKAAAKKPAAKPKASAKKPAAKKAAPKLKGKAAPKAAAIAKGKGKK
eukprot:tig00000711_g3364.t1